MDNKTIKEADELTASTVKHIHNDTHISKIFEMKTAKCIALIIVITCICYHSILRNSDTGPDKGKFLLFPPY